MNERLPFSYKNSDYLPDSARQSEERFTENELEDMRRAFSNRFKSLFPGATDSDIARRLKCTSSVVKNYTDGLRFPNTEMCLTIKRVTGVNLHWLLTGDGDRIIKKTALFSGEEEQKILDFAAAHKIGFDDALKRLTGAALDFLEKF